MVKFMFWNINGKPLAALIREIVAAHGVDIVILAECRIAPGEFLRDWRLPDTAPLQHIQILSESIKVFSTFSPDFFRPLFESPRLSIMRVTLPARQEITLCAVHLPSKLHWSPESQVLECTSLARRLREIEAKVAHTKTVVVGDLNMNPFEVGVVGAAGLNATMGRQLASRGARVVQGETYPFLYNPMWNHFGDHGKTACGSYYYDAGEHVNYYWNIFDQLLIRPELLTRFPADGVRVLTESPSVPLLTDDGRPDTRVGSDHLPLVFHLDL